MTTPSKPDLVALANYFDDIEVDENGMCKWTDVANAQTHLRAELNHLASQPSLYEAGLRDMRERAIAVVENFMLAIIPDQCSARETLKFSKEKIAAAIAALPADGGEKDRPSLSELHRRAVKAVEAFADAASYEETMWTGWGDCVVPPYAEMRRVKAQHAVSALRDAQKSGAES